MTKKLSVEEKAANKAARDAANKAARDAAKAALINQVAPPVVVPPVALPVVSHRPKLEVVTPNLFPLVAKGQIGIGLKAEISALQANLAGQRTVATTTRQRLPVQRAAGEAPMYGTVTTMNAIKALFIVEELSNGAAYSVEEIAAKIGKSLSTTRTNLTYMTKPNSPIGAVPLVRRADGKYGIVK